MFIEAYDLIHGTSHYINSNLISIITVSNDMIMATMNNRNYEISVENYNKLTLKQTTTDF